MRRQVDEADAAHVNPLRDTVRSDPLMLLVCWADRYVPRIAAGEDDRARAGAGFERCHIRLENSLEPSERAPGQPEVITLAVNERRVRTQLVC